MSREPREPVVSIPIDAVDPATAAVWRTVGRIARELGDEVRWCLVGGLMVALFTIEAHLLPRATTDIDILGDARARPSATERLAAHVQELGGRLHEVDGVDGDRGFRFTIDDQIVDILAPDGLPADRPALTTGSLRALPIPGGTQALHRTELVEIVVDGEPARLRRPTLIGAILLKARALPVHDRPDDQRRDLIALLSLLDDPRTQRTQLSQGEIRWLRDAEAQLDLEHPPDDVSADAIRKARAAFRLLIA